MLYGSEPDLFDHHGQGHVAVVHATMTLSDVVRNWVLEPVLSKLSTQETQMAATLQDLRTALALLDTKIDEDLAQTVAIVTAVNALIAKLGSALSPDVQAEVNAITALTSKLVSDNPAVQAAIDAANAQP